MKARFTLSEMAYNNVAQGKKVWLPNTNGQLQLDTVDYVKLLKDLRLVQIHLISGDVVEISEDEELLFEVSANKVWAKGTKRRLKGRDIWGTEEVER